MAERTPCDDAAPNSSPRWGLAQPGAVRSSGWNAVLAMRVAEAALADGPAPAPAPAPAPTAPWSPPENEPGGAAGWGVASAAASVVGDALYAPSWKESSLLSDR